MYAVKGNWLLNNSIPSKIVAIAFAMASEIERDLKKAAENGLKDRISRYYPKIFMTPRTGSA